MPLTYVHLFAHKPKNVRNFSKLKSNAKLLTVVSLSDKSLLLKGFVLILGKTNLRAPL